MSGGEGSPSKGPQPPPKLVEGVGEGWEEIDASSPSLNSSNAQVETSKQQQLCGFLVKQSQKGLIKVWRKRWFFFDDCNCCLYYSNQKNEPYQGRIDISAATFSYEVENLPKHQFEIISEGKSSSLQAPNKEVMTYWLTSLQKKRRKFSIKKKKSVIAETELASAGPSHGGLLRDETMMEDVLLEEEEEDREDLPPTGMEADQMDEDGFQLRTISMRQRLKEKFRPISMALTGVGASGGGAGGGVVAAGSTGGVTGGGARMSPVNQRKSLQHLSPSTPPVNMDGSPEPYPVGEVSPDSNSAISPFRPTRLSGRNITNRLSSLVNRGKPMRPEMCPNCLKAQENISYLENELGIKEREVKDRDEINEFLRKEIRLGDMRAKVEQELAVPSSKGVATGKNNRVDVLVQREQTISELEKLLEDVHRQKDEGCTQLDRANSQVQDLQDQVGLFKEAIVAKDAVVVDLTNKVFQLEHKGQIPADPQMVMFPSTRQALEEDLKTTEEALEAYKQQNKFLSSELAELNSIRSDELDALKYSNHKLHEVEAHMCKVESKYMILLQETQQPRAGNDSGPSPDLVSRMLEEALEGEGSADGRVLGTKSRSNSYDSYGFNRASVGTGETIQNNDPLMVKARKLENQAHSVESAIHENVVSQKVKWENFMVGKPPIQRSEELKMLIRGGVPQERRTQIWKWIVLDTVGKKFEKGLYQKILDQHEGQNSVAVREIELDLLRTLPTNKYYDRPDAQGINKLRQVLVAFSWYDREVGYCQGLNRLAAIALLFLDEEDSFWCLVAIVQHLLPSDYYSKALLGSQTDQRVLKELLDARWHRLSQHLAACEVNFSLITFSWFHTIYVDNLPVETMLRIWDTFLYEGSKVLFRFALAIFKFNEEKILSMDTSIAIFNHVRGMCQDCHDIDKLVQTGFYEVKKFSKKWIDNKRTYHHVQLEKELLEMNDLRVNKPKPVTQGRARNSVDDLVSFDVREDLGPSDADSDIEL